VRAERLDEALAILAGLWSGEPFSFAGKHHRVDETVFLPRPFQRPRPPVWIAGRWPARPAFRRAARWDGMFPIFANVGHAEMPAPLLLDEAVAYVRAQRSADAGPFDVVLEGQTPGPGSGVPERYEPLTWWVEKLGWFRGSVEDTRRRIALGPG
jgi:alkanesulfonate monooxygenase SsuD/methylene tetrahydromethanopterin reductase-like flavin-dependent oxidoreductase (luciferase family)